MQNHKNCCCFLLPGSIQSKENPTSSQPSLILEDTLFPLEVCRHWSAIYDIVTEEMSLGSTELFLPLWKCIFLFVGKQNSFFFVVAVGSWRSQEIAWYWLFCISFSGLRFFIQPVDSIVSIIPEEFSSIVPLNIFLHFTCSVSFFRNSIHVCVGSPQFGCLTLINLCQMTCFSYSHSWHIVKSCSSNDSILGWAFLDVTLIFSSSAFCQWCEEVWVISQCPYLFWP